MIIFFMTSDELEIACMKVKITGNKELISGVTKNQLLIQLAVITQVLF